MQKKPKESIIRSLQFDSVCDSSKSSFKVLLFGYNGANNTGSEARLISIIEDVRDVFGPEVHITVPTFNEENLRRYLKEESYLDIVSIPSIFFFSLKRLVKKHDLVMLVEGSCYMDTWASALLWAFLWATRCAHAYRKPCIAYAVDTGDLSSLNMRLVKREASKTDLIITRTQKAVERLRSIGVTAPIEVTADCAFNFKIDINDRDIFKRIWPEAKGGIIGLSVVDFYLWPVVIRPWGREEDCYRWPYYFSRSKDRRESSQNLAINWAKEADRIVETHDKNIALICMEELDEPLAREIKKNMQNSSRARIFSSKDFNASQMTVILQCLDLLVTSRYHAAVLALGSAIPQIAVGHDNRLKEFYRELGLFDDYFIQHTSGDMWDEIRDKLDFLLKDKNTKIMQNVLKKGYEEHLHRAKRNPKILHQFFKEGWIVGS